MLPPPYRIFLDRISRRISKKRIFTDPLHTLAYGTDASLYRLIPKIVIKAMDQGELSAILSLARELSLPVTVRTAGTSLSGQASSDSILVALNWGFKGCWVSEKGDKIKLEPGVIGEFANHLLRPYHKKIGPDPASISSAMIGGIINNNSSGMCCGVEENSYKTVEALKIMLADGSILDTADPDSVARFRESRPDLLKGLTELAEEVGSDIPLREKIIQKYKIKNTTGYSLNALVDFIDPLDILTHLIVGSEGTLAILLDVTLRTVDEHPLKASAMIYYPEIYSACKAVELLKTQLRKYVYAVELFDRISIRTVEDRPIAPAVMKTLGPEACALLVETRSFDREGLEGNIKLIWEKLTTIPSLQPVEFSSDPQVYSHYWTLRKGLIPSIGAIRKTGSTVIIEDVAFPIEYLAEATLEIQGLFRKYGYREGIVMGHALEGNLHLVFSQELSSPEEVERYRGFMDELCQITAEKYHGSLKAEHGTGRNVAPFVEMEWGKKAYGIMQRIKTLFDPENLLNPGVLINNDPDLHIKNLKSMPATHPLVDKCIECGFCESECPSRSHSLTPRQRIVVSRELSRMRENWKSLSKEERNNFKVTERLFRYEGDESCAGCSMCEPACPVSINTGKLMKELRFSQKTFWQNWVADMIAKQFSATTQALNVLLRVNAWAGGMIKEFAPAWAARLDALPQPVAFQKIRTSSDDGSLRKKVVYFPSCVSRNLSSPSRLLPLTEIIPRVLEKSGYEVIYPPGKISQYCCGMAFSSKGYRSAADLKWEELRKGLEVIDEDIPILIDTSPCVAMVRERMESQGREVMDPIAFIRKYLLERLDVKPIKRKVTIHTTCSASRMGLEEGFIDLARRLAAEVVVPQEIKCCGFAGDKGFRYPRLNADALRGLRGQIEGCEQGYSTSVTCEFGLSRHGRIPYNSIFYLVAEAAGIPTEEDR